MSDKMRDKKSQIAFEEFVEFCDIFLEKANNSKGKLAEQLGLEFTKWSKMYHGHRRVPGYILAKVKQLAEGKESQISENPEKVATREELPLSSNQGRDESVAQRALQDQNRRELLELRDRVAVLEENVKQTKADSEKKIYRLEAEFAAALKYEIERATGSFAGGKANG